MLKLFPVLACDDQPCFKLIAASFELLNERVHLGYFRPCADDNHYFLLIHLFKLFLRISMYAPIVFLTGGDMFSGMSSTLKKHSRLTSLI
jgi:hypothetical protein